MQQQDPDHSWLVQRAQLLWLTNTCLHVQRNSMLLATIVLCGVIYILLNNVNEESAPDLCRRVTK